MTNIIVIPHIYILSYFQGALSNLQIIFKSSYSSQILWKASRDRFYEYCLNQGIWDSLSGKSRLIQYVSVWVSSSWHPCPSCLLVFSRGPTHSFLFDQLFLNTITPHSTALSSRQNGNLCCFSERLGPSVFPGTFANNHKHTVLGESLFKYLVHSKEYCFIEFYISPTEGRWWRAAARILACDSELWALGSVLQPWGTHTQLAFARGLCTQLGSEDLSQEMGLQGVNLTHKGNPLVPDAFCELSLSFFPCHCHRLLEIYQDRLSGNYYHSWGLGCSHYSISSSDLVLAVWPWASDITTLGLSFIKSKRGRV
jgi:hypothetical protein